MNLSNQIRNKILTSEQAFRLVSQWRTTGKKIVFTNGCFDILHAGHIASLMEAASYGDHLVVGLNADRSIKKLKGKSRPVNDEQSRALVLAALAMVDAVVLFEEDTPRDLVKLLLPDFLVKGGDYKPEDIAGAKEVQDAGGQVIINPILPGFSTTAIIEKLQKS